MSRKQSQGQGQRLEEDAFIDKMVATTMEWSRTIQEVNAYRAAQPKYLLVLDSKTVEDFLAKANQVHREAHDSKRRKDVEAFNTIVTLCLKEVDFQPALGTAYWPTQGRMVKALEERNCLSPNTARKYAKLFTLSFRAIGDKTQLTEKEETWLVKEVGPDWRNKTFLNRRFFQT